MTTHSIPLSGDEENRPYVPPVHPGQAPRPSPEIYAVMGEENIFRMLEDFYLELEQSQIRHLFPRNMVKASQKSAAFFVTLLGGPPLYYERYGPPRMRARHMPFAIDYAGRQEWLDCFLRVLEDAPAKYDFPEAHLPVFREFLTHFSEWMVNTK
jgi:hemoglobin